MYIFTNGFSVVLFFTGISVAVPFTGVQSIKVRGFGVVHTLTNHFRQIEYTPPPHTHVHYCMRLCAIKICHSGSKVGQGRKRLESKK